MEPFHSTVIQNLFTDGQSCHELTFWQRLVNSSFVGSRSEIITVTSLPHFGVVHRVLCERHETSVLGVRFTNRHKAVRYA
jgi:hypothetical protein